MYENIHRNHPVVFHYSSPNNLMKLNAKNSEFMQYDGMLPRAQVQVISYPLQAPPLHYNSTYFPPTSSVYVQQQPPCYLSQPPTFIRS
jgi:hypothetical protein